MKKRVDITIDEELLERIDKIAKKMSLTRSSVIRMAFVEWLTEKEKNSKLSHDD